MFNGKVFYNNSNKSIKCFWKYQEKDDLPRLFETFYIKPGDYLCEDVTEFNKKDNFKIYIIWSKRKDYGGNSIYDEVDKLTYRQSHTYLVDLVVPSYTIPFDKLVKVTHEEFMAAITTLHPENLYY